MATAPLTGLTLEDRYRLSGALGSGNFGTVYLAQELIHGVPVRDVALKIYSREATMSGNVEGMFEDCAFPERILSSDASWEIKRHFVHVYAWGRLLTPEGECAFVSMELVRGAVTFGDLATRHAHAGHHPSENEVLAYMRQFFTALGAAHGADVYHRDIKGGNVMLTEGILKMVDFGMGQRPSAGRVLLKTTLSIYAPENFDGRYTAASDIYQAGLMFYHFWTGIQPFAQQSARLMGESEEAHGRRLTDEARNMRLSWHYVRGEELGCANSVKLDALLSKCLRFNDAERYQNAMEVLRDLDRDGISVAREAHASGDYAFALKTARAALEEGAPSPLDRAELHFLMGDSNLASGAAAAAKECYIETLKLAEQTGVYFLDRPRMRALLTALSDCCAELGQKGLSNMYRKKIGQYV